MTEASHYNQDFRLDRSRCFPHASRIWPEGTASPYSPAGFRD